MSMPQLDLPKLCPSQSELQAFIQGNLSYVQLEMIGEHLSNCEQCSKVLIQVGESSDPLVAKLRGTLTEAENDVILGDSHFQRMVWNLNREILASTPEPAAPEELLPSPITAATQLGEYNLVKEIGHGGMGKVFCAVHRGSKNQAAVKVLSPIFSADPKALARFQREIKANHQLDHSNIVKAFDAGEARGFHYLVMELVDGIDLSKLVHRFGKVGVADACELVRQAGLALQAVHECGIVHRDVKPSNLIVSRQGQVKLLDLGLALFRTGQNSSTRLTGTNELMGTADFMAPEQCSSVKNVDIRGDLYSLGCTLYTLLGGQPPFGSWEYTSVIKKMSAHAEKQPTPIRERCPEVPAELQSLLEKLLAKDPPQRFQTPGEMLTAIEPFCAKSDLQALVGKALCEDHDNELLVAPTTKARRRFLMRIAALGLILALLASVAWLALR